MSVAFRILDKKIIEDVLVRAEELLSKVGVEVEDPEVLDLLGTHGAVIDRTKRRAALGHELISSSLKTAPAEFLLFDRSGQRACRVGGDEVCFVPGSSALRIYDRSLRREREGVRDDLDRLARLTERIKTYGIQSTALVPADVPRAVADRVRLFHALRGSTKPIVTGTFLEDGFEPMACMLEAVRGDRQALRDKPLAIFDCCPTPPLKWPRLTSRALVECARLGIPGEIIPVPLLGATGPATLHGALVQIAAENLSGIVISQCASASAPVVWGGCPMAFDMKYGTTLTGAPETMLLNAASAEVAKFLNLPCHGYLALSDSKVHDLQAGFETAAGALVAACSGVNIVSGAGMLNFIGCQSLEKLVFDAEVGEAALRIRRGIELHREDNLVDLFQEAAASSGFLGLKHTRSHFRKELCMPGAAIDRAATDSGTDTFSRCAAAVDSLLAAPGPEPLPPEVERALGEIVERELKKNS